MVHHPGEELLIEGRKGSMAFWIDTKANTKVLPNASHGGCPVSIKTNSSDTFTVVCIMAFPVVEFSRQGYKISKVFG